nr:hypothetical protein [Tanacetum cinerariifolium]
MTRISSALVRLLSAAALASSGMAFAAAPAMTSDGALTDHKGMTLYTYDKDTSAGKSIGDVQQPGSGGQFTGFSGKRHGHAPGKRGAQYHLRIVGVALHERVTGRKGQPADRQPDGCRIGEQDQYEAQRNQHSKERQGFFRPYLATDQRPLLGTFDVAVHLAVGIVVNHAARRAHQKHADDEDEQRTQGWRAFACDPHGPECGPEQQVNADGLVDARELDEVPDAWMQTGAGTERVHVQTVAFQRGAASNAAGKYPSFIVAEQIDLTHPTFAVCGQLQQTAFIVAQPLPSFVQRLHAESVIRKAGQASSEGVFVKQPLKNKGRSAALFCAESTDAFPAKAGPTGYRALARTAKASPSGYAALVGPAKANPTGYAVLVGPALAGKGPLWAPYVLRCRR